MSKTVAIYLEREDPPEPAGPPPYVRSVFNRRVRRVLAGGHATATRMFIRNVNVGDRLAVTDLDGTVIGHVLVEAVDVKQGALKMGPVPA